MVSTFLVTVNLPGLVRSGGRAQWQWTELLVASAIGSVAFLVAHSYGDRSRPVGAGDPPRFG